MQHNIIKCVIGLFGVLTWSTFMRPVSAAEPHYVFAHYMVCYATYGQSVAGFKREIQEAQAAGIDGFVLDIGEWNHPIDKYYNQRVALLYQAAEQLGTGFKFLPFIEFSNPTNILNLVESYGNRTSTFRYHGKIVLSSWGMNYVPAKGPGGLDWRGKVLDPLQRAGYPVFFIPHFWPPHYHELPSYADAETVLNYNGNILSGLFLAACAGPPPALADCNSNYTQAVHAAGKIFMASYSPHYWGSLQRSNGRRYFESAGGEGTILQWTAIIKNQPDWVDMFTWNDFNESTYTTPVLDPEQYESQISKPHRYSHAGYLELSKYYINWYKTGQEPPIRQDAVFYFYRTQPKDAVAADVNDVPVRTLFRGILDVIYTTVFLTAPAQLEINSGNQTSTHSLPAGISNVRVPFVPGAQKFVLTRAGEKLISLQGPDIQAAITNYDFFPASGFAYGPAPAR